MKVRCGKTTKDLLLERGIYGKVMNEARRIEKSDRDRENLEYLLRECDKPLLDEYAIVYFSGTKYDLSFFLTKGRKR